MTGQQVTIYTPTGFLLTLLWTGEMPGDGILFSNANCTGNAWLTGLNDVSILGKSAYYAESTGNILIPSNVGANGTAARTLNNPASSEYFNGSCGAAVFGTNGYALQVATPAQVGLPGLPVTTPLQVVLP